MQAPPDGHAPAENIKPPAVLYRGWGLTRGLVSPMFGYLLSADRVGDLPELSHFPFLQTPDLTDDLSQNRTTCTVGPMLTQACLERPSLTLHFAFPIAERRPPGPCRIPAVQAAGPAVPFCLHFTTIRRGMSIFLCNRQIMDRFFFVKYVHFAHIFVTCNNNLSKNLAQFHKRQLHISPFHTNIIIFITFLLTGENDPW